MRFVGRGAPAATQRPKPTPSLRRLPGGHRARGRRARRRRARTGARRLARGDLADLAVSDVRHILIHVVTEVACHSGHLDATRELIDGATWLGGNPYAG